MTVPGPQFSLTVQPSKLGTDEVRHVLSADAAERAALARRFDLVGIARFDADLRLKWVRGGRIFRLRGTIGAEITQTCVVTLEPLVNTIEESFEILHHPAPAGAVAGAPTEGRDGGPGEGSEPFYGDSLDIAEIATRELSLALDPYPRKPGVRLRFSDESGDQVKRPVRGKSPFEVLAVYKGKK